MNEYKELTMEQEFNVCSFEQQVDKMSHQQAQDFLKRLYKLMVIREAMYKDFLKIGI